MKNISEIDKNFKNQQIMKNNMKVYDVEEKPFKIYGIFKPENESKFIRIPREIAEAANEGVRDLNNHTSGGRVRFRTDSQYIALKCHLPYVNLMAHMPLSGSAGFDIYADGKYIHTYIPDCGASSDSAEYEGIAEFEDRKMRDIVINFPLYNAVEKVFIGIEDSAQLKSGEEYLHKVPVVFYGSSITQGGCVSRPGNLYASVLSRRMNFDFVNLGFSGSARGEDAIAEYISKLNMSIFVYDYDFNAPDAQHLRNTHYKMYKTIRNNNPDIPIVMASRPCMCGKKEDVEERIKIIEDTMKKAKSEGDNNIYFVNGIDMFYSHDSDMMTVDGCHPNDFGSYCMAEAFEGVIKKLL
ncbi:MAG: SGNH/GDSL hydrolase family protein [Clostridia bacterium]|nr:SGNH/GDSL hydrolase family protein [Clostridia bacterium]